jgi:diguanylate cyclase (GGDEF)-like protein/PAS domain S-box-containing protein
MNEQRNGNAAELIAVNQLFATVRYDRRGQIKSANHRFVRLIGHELEDILGSNGELFEPAGVTPPLQSEAGGRVLDGDTYREGRLWLTKTGRELWLDMTFVPIGATSDDDFEIVQIISDLTDQQEKLADERGQIEAIRNTQAVIQFSLDGHVLDANAQFLQAMGYELSEVLGKHHSIFVDPVFSNRQEYRDFWLSLGRGTHHSGEYRRRHKTGRDVWLQAVYSPVLDLAGRPIKIVKFATDRTAEKLRQADYEWQINAIHKSNCVVTLGMNGTILDANDKFLHVIGYSLEEVEGRHHRILVDRAEAHGLAYNQFWHALRRGEHQSGLYKRVGKDGRQVWLQATYNPIFDANGIPSKVVNFSSVVTEERLLQAEYQGQIAAINQAQCVISFSLDGTITDANDKFLELTGYRFGEVYGRHHSMFVSANAAASDDYRRFWRELSLGLHKAGEYKRIGKDGREIWLQATYNPILDMEGRPFKIVKYAVDVTAERLKQADFEGQIEAITKSQGVVALALDGTILDVNDNFLATLGFAREDIIGKHHSHLVEKSYARSMEYSEFWETLRRGRYHAGLYKRLGKDGKEIWIQASYNPILDLNGQPRKVIKYATDVTSNVALAEAFEDAKRQAHLDPGTSLPNRTKLVAFMETALASAAASMTVLYIDLDRFKPINDTHGHHVGDLVLAAVADRLRRAIRPDQIVARVGGDEFVIAAPAMPVETVERFCGKLMDMIAAPIRHESGELTVGVSIGVAVAPMDGTTPDELLRAADTALYRSKQSGRGQFSYFAAEMNDKIMMQRKMTEDMRHSLTAGHFFLEYQPRFDTRARQMRSVEALVRWAHPERGRIPPGDFIPLAEQNGLIVPLGDWILDTACEAAANWSGIGVSVNVSPVQFRDPKFVEKVRNCLRRSGLNGELLELEITEGVLLEDADLAIEVLNALKAMGVKLAMDDFGTGYSSLSYLRNFPFDVIKIDRSFISDLDTRESARPIVQAILGLGRALGLTVTAEGVETNEQLALLTADHCSEIQGFLMSRPLSEAKISELVEKVPEIMRDALLQTAGV